MSKKKRPTRSGRGRGPSMESQRFPRRGAQGEDVGRRTGQAASSADRERRLQEDGERRIFVTVLSIFDFAALSIGHSGEVTLDEGSLIRPMLFARCPSPQIALEVLDRMVRLGILRRRRDESSGKIFYQRVPKEEMD